MGTRLPAVVACVVTLAFGLGACSSGSAKVSGPTTTATSPSVTTTPGPELRGVPVKTFACPRSFTAPTAATVPIGSVEELAVCRSAVVPVNPVFVRAGDAGFSKLIKALGEPSQPLSHGVCPDFADAPFVVLAKTDQGVYSVPIPTDGCRHYLSDARLALNQMR